MLQCSRAMVIIDCRWTARFRRAALNLALGRHLDIRTNDIVDIIDRLAQSGGPDAVWETALEIGRAWGIASLNMASVTAETGELSWMRSSMSEAWLGEYMSQQYYECDPLLALFQGQDTHMSVGCGLLNKADGHSAKAVGLNHGLRDAGYSALQGYKILAPGAKTGKIVTFCFDQSEVEDLGKVKPKCAAAAGMFATFVQPAKSADQAGFVALPHTVLSVREREVLSLLAEGKQSARIAEQLGLAEVTVHKHFSTAKLKLGASTREQALFEAMRRNLIWL